MNAHERISAGRYFMKIKVVFEKTLKKEVLDIFGKKVDEDETIVEKDDPTQKVLTPDGEDIKLTEFAGIAKGSQVFIKSDLVSLINFSKRMQG